MMMRIVVSPKIDNGPRTTESFADQAHATYSAAGWYAAVFAGGQGKTHEECLLQ